MYARKQSKWVKIRKTYGHSVQVDMYALAKQEKNTGHDVLTIVPNSDKIRLFQLKLKKIRRIRCDLTIDIVPWGFQLAPDQLTC